MKIEFDKYGDGTIELFIEHNDGFKVCSKDEINNENSFYKVELKICERYFDGISSVDYYDGDCIDDYLNYIKEKEFHCNHTDEKFEYEWTATSIEDDIADISVYSCTQREMREPVFGCKGWNGNHFYGDNILRVAGIYYCIDEYISNGLFISYGKERYFATKKN